MNKNTIKSAMAWTLGIGVLALILLIMIILFGNLQGNVGFGTTSVNYYNETITLNGSATPESAKSTAAILVVNGVISGVTMTNATGGETVPASNYTINGVVIINQSSEYYTESVNVSYTLTKDTIGKIDTDNTIFNYTTSATNTAKQLPTVGTIVGIAILLGVLIAILIYAIRSLSGLGGGNSIGGTSTRFSGAGRASIG